MSFFVATRHSSMDEADKGQPSSVRVPRHRQCPAPVVSDSRTSSPMHSPSPGTEECPGWKATP